MASFYGRVQARRGAAVRKGDDCMTALVACWSGAIKTRLYLSPGGVTMVLIRVEGWVARGPKSDGILYDGPLAALMDAIAITPVQLTWPQEVIDNANQGL